jgi:hypothetical protein
LAGTISIDPASTDDLTSVGLTSDGPQRGTVVSLSVPVVDEDD